MLEDLLQKKVIELPECKHPEETNHINHPKYCMLKDLIMKLAQQGRIKRDLDKVVESNHARISFVFSDLAPSPSLQPLGAFSETHELKPYECVEVLSQSSVDSSDDDNEGWTLVTRKKLHNKNASLPRTARSKRCVNKRSSPQPRDTTRGHDVLPFRRNDVEKKWQTHFGKPKNFLPKVTPRHPSSSSRLWRITKHNKHLPIPSLPKSKTIHHVTRLVVMTCSRSSCNGP
ncbi:hypothetical protein ACE6H2_017227 [Prunus campanulata]